MNGLEITCMCFRILTYRLYILSLDVSSCFRHAVDMSGTDLVRLGQYVMSRRAALGYKHRVDLANALPITDRTLADIENGVRVAGAGTYAILENELRWKPGSAAAILAGREPTELSEPTTGLREASTGDIFAGVYDLLGELHRRVDSRGAIAPDDTKNLPNWGRGIRSGSAAEDSRVRRDKKSL